MKKVYSANKITVKTVRIDTPIADSNWVYYDDEGNYTGMGGGSGWNRPRPIDEQMDEE